MDFTEISNSNPKRASIDTSKFNAVNSTPDERKAILFLDEHFRTNGISPMNRGVFALSVGIDEMQTTNIIARFKSFGLISISAHDLGAAPAIVDAAAEVRRHEEAERRQRTLSIRSGKGADRIQ